MKMIMMIIMMIKDINISINDDNDDDNKKTRNAISWFLVYSVTRNLRICFAYWMYPVRKKYNSNVTFSL